MDRICELHASNPNFQLDTSKEYRKSFSEADLIVTDLSGTGFTFSLATGRPALFFAPNPEVEIGLTGIQFTDRESIGGVARNVPELLQLIATMDFSGMATRIADYKRKVLFNPATSPEYVAKAIGWIMRGEACPESVVL